MGSCMSRNRGSIQAYCKLKDLIPGYEVEFTFYETLTKSEILRLREEFWIMVLSSPNRLERRAMRTAKRAIDCILAGSFESAQHVINESEYYVPKGDLSMLMDGEGHAYLIPLYCLALPVNTIEG